MVAEPKRKGLIKPGRNSFHKEYSFEIKVILLFTLGIFLLIEDLEIKQYIFEAIRTIFFYYRSWNKMALRFNTVFDKTI